MTGQSSPASWNPEHMLFSDGHNQLVACMCNYSDKPHMLKANSFLTRAEPAEHVPETGGEIFNLNLASSDNVDVSVLPDMPK